MNSNLFKTLDTLTKQYLIKEANDEDLPFPTGEEGDQGDKEVDAEVEMDINEPQADDPTETLEIFLKMKKELLFPIQSLQCSLIFF